jgi:predicted metal-dependent hydrolase
MFKRKNTDGKSLHLPQYTLIRSDRKTVGLQIKNGKLIVRAPRSMREEEIVAFICIHRRWVEKHLSEAEKREKENNGLTPLSREEILELCEKARKIIPERVEYYSKVIGVTCGRITIRNQRTRWGSCTGKGNLNFNCLLMLVPTEVLDYVVVHELCHRKEMNHSKRFYDEVARIIPDYKRQRDWLRDHGEAIMKRSEQI